MSYDSAEATEVRYVLTEESEKVLVFKRTDGSLVAVPITPGPPGPEGPASTVPGPSGPAGPPGAAGAAGPPGSIAGVSISDAFYAHFTNTVPPVNSLTLDTPFTLGPNPPTRITSNKYARINRDGLYVVTAAIAFKPTANAEGQYTFNFDFNPWLLDYPPRDRFRGWVSDFVHPTTMSSSSIGYIVSSFTGVYPLMEGEAVGLVFNFSNFGGAGSLALLNTGISGLSIQRLDPSDISNIRRFTPEELL